MRSRETKIRGCAGQRQEPRWYGELQAPFTLQPGSESLTARLCRMLALSISDTDSCGSLARSAALFHIVNLPKTRTACHSTSPASPPTLLRDLERITRISNAHASPTRGGAPHPYVPRSPAPLRLTPLCRYASLRHYRQILYRLYSIVAHNAPFPGWGRGRGFDASIRAWREPQHNLNFVAQQGSLAGLKQALCVLDAIRGFRREMTDAAVVVLRMGQRPVCNYLPYTSAGVGVHV